MKRLAIFLALALFVVTFRAQDTTTTATTNKHELTDELAFKVGEKLDFKVRYGLLNAGKMELKVQSKMTADQHEVMHLTGRGWSVGMTDLFFKVDDRYETYFDTKMMAPTEFVRDVYEGGYTINRHILFDHQQGVARDLKATEKDSFQVPFGVQDIFSTFYYARNVNTENIKVNDVINIDMFLDHKLYPFQLRYIGTEMLKTDFGKLRCKKFVPQLQEGRIFKDDEGMVIWVSDDKNKIPVLLKTKLLIGSLKAELVDYENLKYPIHFE